jgi:hypothetical protein
MTGLPIVVAGLVTFLAGAAANFLVAGAAVAATGGKTAGHVFFFYVVFYVVVGGGLALMLVVKTRRGPVHPVHLSGRSALAGGEMTATINGRRITFDVPPGVRSRSVVRVPGKGPDGRDLYVRVNVHG